MTFTGQYGYLLVSHMTDLLLHDLIGLEILVKNISKILEIEALEEHFFHGL